MQTPLINIGVAQKPPQCKLLCPYFSVGSGFVADWKGNSAQVAFLLPFPTGDDSINRQGLSGKAGWAFEKNYLRPLGKSRQDCLVSHVIRCRPKGNGSKFAKWGTYPTGSARKGAESACRFYDREVIERFDPNLFILTFSPMTVYQEPAFTRLLARDIQKAFEFAEKGFRPICLLGNEAAELVAPYIDGKGGVKAWRSHWEELPNGWPFLNAPAAPQKGFAVV